MRFVCAWLFSLCSPFRFWLIVTIECVFTAHQLMWKLQSWITKTEWSMNGTYIKLNKYNQLSAKYVLDGSILFDWWRVVKVWAFAPLKSRPLPYQTYLVSLYCGFETNLLDIKSATPQIASKHKLWKTIKCYHRPCEQ